MTPDADAAVEKERPAIQDPFLLLKYGDKEYYFAVWNEPDFLKE